MVFDIDGTLTPLGQPLKREISQGLCTLEQRGYRVGFASGKPCPYIEGFARAIGLQDYFALGENGAVYLDTYNGHVYPLVERHSEFDELAKELVALFPEVFFQCNAVNLSVFCEDMNVLASAISYLKKKGWTNRQDVTAYIHPDCMDIVPAGVDKGTAIAYLKQRNGWDTSQVLAVGDSINDEPMKREAVFYAVGSDIDAELSFENGVEMIRYLLDCFLPL
jgi:HAD superfamily hydrolase (TIGR01484 family)